MNKLTAADPETKSVDLALTNIVALRALFPELITEGPGGVALNLDVLKQLVGDRTVTEVEEKYGLNWNGKRRTRQLALTPSTGTLRPCVAESVQWNTTQNLIIEGDNLEVLKLLQKSYAGKVKLIYIDPPYNTGKDFVYPDNFQDNIKNYLELTGQVEGGKQVGSNIESSGRFHTDWLNMMYPRLKLARNLLREDGVIFVSIDDNEEPRLRLIADEIFGPENFLTTLFVQVRYEGKTLVEDSDFQKLIEQVLVYRKSAIGKLNKLTEEYTIEKFAWEIVASGTPKTLTLGNKRVEVFAPGSYEIRRVTPSKHGLKEIWASGKVLDGNSSGRFFRDFLEGRVAEDGLGALYKVEGIGDDEYGYRYFTGPLRAGATKGKYYQGVPRARLEADAGSKESPIPCFYNFADAFGNCRHEGNVDFRNGKKPLAFLNQLLELGTSGRDGELVLDFFAGSGTTGHAVFESNEQGKGNRRFILVQLPEPTGQVEFPTISEITKERVRRAGKKLREENPTVSSDVGFRVFKLASSNIRAWEPDRDRLAETIEASVEHLKSDRTEQDILFELLLKLGLDLCVPIETRQVGGNAEKVHEVYSIGGGSLIACLSRGIPQADVEPLALSIVAWHRDLKPAGEATVVFRDSAFADDVTKTNLTVILQQHGLDAVRSL